MKMKISLLFLIIPFLGITQEPNFHSTHQLIEPQTFALKSKYRTLTGKDETNFTFKVPQNTEKIIYSFSTSPIKAPAKSTNLFVEISKLVSGGMFTGITKSLTQPTGVNACDVQVWKNNVLYSLASRENFSSGIVEFKPRSNHGGYYDLKIKNVTTNSGINATVEIVAIVKDVEAESKYNLKKTSQELGESLTDLAELLQKNKAEKSNKHENEMQIYRKLGYKKLGKGDNDGAIQIFSEFTTKKNSFKFVGYNGIASAYRNKGNFSKAIENHNKCIKETKKKKCYKGQCYSNLGLTYLIMGDELNANKCYLEFMNSCNGNNSKQIRLAVAQEIENKQKKIGEIEGAADIIELLKGK